MATRQPGRVHKPWHRGPWLPFPRSLSSLNSPAAHQPPLYQRCSLPPSRGRSRSRSRKRRRRRRADDATSQGNQGKPWGNQGQFLHPGAEGPGSCALAMAQKEGTWGQDRACWRGGSGPALCTETLGPTSQGRTFQPIPCSLQKAHDARTHRCACRAHTRTHTPRVHTDTFAHRHACAQGRSLPSRHAALASTESGRNKSLRLCNLPEPLLALLCVPLRGWGASDRVQSRDSSPPRMQGRPSWGDGTDPQPGPQEGTCQSCTQGPGTAACSGGLGEVGPSTRQSAPGWTFLEAGGPGPLSGPALLSRGVEARGASSHLEMAVWTQTRDTGVPRGGRRTRERWNAWGGQGSRNMPGTQCWPEAA